MEQHNSGRFPSLYTWEAAGNNYEAMKDMLLWKCIMSGMRALVPDTVQVHT